MSSLAHTAPRLGGILSAGGLVVATGRIGILLAFSLLAVLVALITVAGLAGIFGGPHIQESAQVVLAILLSRGQPRAATPSREARRQPKPRINDPGNRRSLSR